MYEKASKHEAIFYINSGNLFFIKEGNILQIIILQNGLRNFIRPIRIHDTAKHA